MRGKAQADLYDAAARMLYEGRNLSRAALLSSGANAGQL